MTDAGVGDGDDDDDDGDNDDDEMMMIMMMMMVRGPHWRIYRAPEKRSTLEDLCPPKTIIMNPPIIKVLSLNPPIIKL